MIASNNAGGKRRFSSVLLLEVACNEYEFLSHFGAFGAVLIVCQFTEVAFIRPFLFVNNYSEYVSI